MTNADDAVSVDGAPALRELASGVDALYLSGAGLLPKELLADLVDFRERARDRDGEIVFRPLGEQFTIAPGPLGRYPYRLEHRAGVVGLTDSTTLPPVRVQPRSEFLHARGPAAAVAWFAQVLEPACGPLAFSVNRLDLYADFQGWELTSGDGPNFVCRATNRNTREESNDLTGFEFGKRGGRAVFLRIYDKTVEGRAKGFGHWPAVWGDKYVAGERVLRVEYQFGRSVLKQLGVESPEDALARSGEVWGYATRKWASLRVPGRDETRARWEIDRNWRAVQNAALSLEAIPADRIYAASQKSGLDGVWPGLRGYFATMAAYGNCESVDDALAMLARLVARDEARTDYPFTLRIRAKRQKLRLA